MTETLQALPKKVDILVVGGAYVGLTTAVAINSGAPDLSILVVDAMPVTANENDTRASAIAADATRMLQRLNIWQKIEANAQPIHQMVVTDSKLSDVVRPVFLTFSNDQNDEQDKKAPFAHMVPNRDLVQALREKAEELGISIAGSQPVNTIRKTPTGYDVSLVSGQSVSTRLLVAADGVRSKMRAAAGIKTVSWPYDQKGIVATVAHERPHNGVAIEHFLPAGPFAILPLKGNRSSLVWTESSTNADRILAMDPFHLELELERRFGHELGELSIESEVRAFPLGLTLARDFVKDRIALVGDAAHGIHPIAGQGLNLGFKDAAALAETIVDAHRLGLDFGSLSSLERYQLWRRFDTVQMGVVTDILNRLFSNDNAIIRSVRDIGLGIVDRLPGLKDQFINRAAGNNSSAPKLLAGEPL